MQRGGIVWFRQDLRIHDNEALFEAIKSCSFIVPIYVFDERIFNGKTRFGFPKINVPRYNFIIESAINLKENLLQKNIELIIKIGKPEEIIFTLAQESKTSWIFCNRERTQEEIKVQDALEQKLWSIGQEIRYSRGKMLYYTSDLPFPVTHTPDSFPQFRKELERFVPVRNLLKIDLNKFNVYLGQIKSDPIPKFKKETSWANDNRLKGGETEAKSLLSNLYNRYTASNNSENLLFSQLSAYLSQGCLSLKCSGIQFKKWNKIPLRKNK